MIRVTAVNCADHEAICKKEGVTETPAYKVYPPFPVPVQDLPAEQNHDFGKLKSLATRHFQARTVDITQNNHQTFIEDQPGKPKVLLFTKAKGVPLIYKALSSHFEVRLDQF